MVTRLAALVLVGSLCGGGLAVAQDSNAPAPGLIEVTYMPVGAGFVPAILNTAVYDEVLAVADDDAVKLTRALARFEGLLVGISSGAACAAAIAVARRLGRGSVVLTVFPDTGERYLTTELFQAEGI